MRVICMRTILSIVNRTNSAIEQPSPLVTSKTCKEFQSSKWMTGKHIYQFCQFCLRIFLSTLAKTKEKNGGRDKCHYSWNYEARARPNNRYCDTCFIFIFLTKLCFLSFLLQQNLSFYSLNTVLS